MTSMLLFWLGVGNGAVGLLGEGGEEGWGVFLGVLLGGVAVAVMWRRVGVLLVSLEMRCGCLFGRVESCDDDACTSRSLRLYTCPLQVILP